METQKVSETPIVEELAATANLLTEDNGEIKRIPSRTLVAVPNGVKVGQMIIVKAVDETGKPTEWEAVDRTHWVESGDNVEVIPETTLIHDEDEVLVVTSEVPNLVAGANYTVNWNGVEYNSVAQELSDVISATFIGNGALAGGANTGEPFAIARIFDEDVAEVGAYVLIYVLDGSPSVTLSVYGYGETVHKLPEKYLPPSIGGVVIRSSTADSTKKFKLTVDDSGTITATEVT